MIALTHSPNNNRLIFNILRLVELIFKSDHSIWNVLWAVVNYHSTFMVPKEQFPIEWARIRLSNFGTRLNVSGVVLKAHVDFEDKKFYHTPLSSPLQTIKYANFTLSFSTRNFNLSRFICLPPKWHFRFEKKYEWLTFSNLYNFL